MPHFSRLISGSVSIINENSFKKNKFVSALAATRWNRLQSES